MYMYLFRLYASIVFIFTLILTFFRCILLSVLNLYVLPLQSFVWKMITIKLTIEYTKHKH